MLILTRRKNQRIRIQTEPGLGEEIWITVVRTGKEIKLGIQAPSEMRIEREELIGTPRKPRAP